MSMHSKVSLTRSARSHESVPSAKVQDGALLRYPQSLTASIDATSRSYEALPPANVQSDSLMRRPREKLHHSPASNREAFFRSAVYMPHEQAAYEDELHRDISARESRLHMLRAEVAAKDQEIEQLTFRNRDAAVQLMDVSGRLDTMSAKVETVSGNRSGVLKASAQTGGDKLEMLRRWLARMEWDLTEKDEEIAKLRAATSQGFQMVQHQQVECDTLIHHHQRQEEAAAFLQEERRRVQRHNAVKEWAANVQAKIDRESADVVGRRHLRAFQDQLLEVTQANQSLRANVLRMQDKCKDLRAELERVHKTQESLMVTERVHASTAQIGQGCIEETLIERQADLGDLLVQVKQEQSRTHATRAKAIEYDRKELALMHEQMELMSLTSCLREINRTIANPSTMGIDSMPTADDAVDAAVTEIIESLQDYGMAVPPLLRIGPSEYLCGGELVTCMMRDGSLYVRPSEASAMAQTKMASIRSPRLSPRRVSPRGRTAYTSTVSPSMTRTTGMVPIEDFFRSRSLQAPMTAASPMSRRPPVSPALPTFAAPLIGFQKGAIPAKGLANLVTPLTISANNITL